MSEIWNIIDKYFTDNPTFKVKHHLESYNDFFNNGIKQIFKEKNPIKLMKNQDPKTKEYRLQCSLYLAGKNGDKLYYGKPVIYDDNRTHFMFPNEARLRNMTYGFSIHYDVDVEFRMIVDGEDGEPETILKETTLEKMFLGRFPIMLHSDLCVLNKLSRQLRFNMGECKNEQGGYFIIDGKEKVVVCQERFADNTLYVRDNVNDIYSHAADIRTVSEDASKPVRTLSVRIVAPSPRLTNKQIVVNVPNVRKPVPFFILMRALGVISDRKIIEFCLLDIEKNKEYLDLFVPSIHDAGKIFTQEAALKYIAMFTKGKTIPHVMEILMNYLLPNIGELNFTEKAYFLGHMVNRLLKLYTKEEATTDRDSFRFKRVDLTGTLLYDLFKEYFTLQQRNIFQRIDKEYYYKQGLYQGNFPNLILNNYNEFFRDRIVEDGFRKAFKGNWGAEEHTKRMGIVQPLNRLSFNSATSHLRKINLEMDASAKIVAPRLLHGSQWGIIDPVDTPDGGNVGLHKHMAIAAHITSGCSATPMIRWLKRNGLELLTECFPLYISRQTKVFVNGSWVGVVKDPAELVKLFKKNRRVGLVPIFISIHWDIQKKSIIISTDAGRLCRPIFYIDSEDKNVSYKRKDIRKMIQDNDFTWNQLISGFIKKKDERFDPRKYKFYELDELYDDRSLDSLREGSAVIDFMDTSEQESAYIATNTDVATTKHTHVEIHPSLLLGIMGNQIIFPANNQLPRDLFSCGQSKQAVSLYHSNFQNRIDKMGVVLNYGQIPLIKSRYLEYINNEEHPYGENVIVAIMCYGGYNVEDSILFNEGSVKRGMFRTTYLNMYETREESSKVSKSQVNTYFRNIESENAIGLRPGYDYSHLDKYGMIKENTEMDDKKILIGQVTTNVEDPDTVLDSSVAPKKGQLGFVDKTFITEGEEGFRIAKVRIREERIPAIGDKFCSRCGQKGTVGLVIPEQDMPFTEDGVRPDLIVNPHALPSRMTIGQLVETLMGKACLYNGSFGDCTAFENKGSKHEIFGEMLTNNGYNSTGNQVLYNGMTGEQLNADIFIGPTYYMRLKHMVKDKINYRARGPRTLLTRQTVQGRANDGGLRIGEMERDGVISNGMTHFLNESMLVRGDDYYVAVCNQTGTIAIYNQSKSLFYSLLADGPIKFSTALDGSLNVDSVSKYGRSFSIIRVPYSFKLLMQELQTMNVQMRVITEDNIDQLTSMSYSDNIEKLTNNQHNTPDQISKMVQRQLGTIKADTERVEFQDDDRTEDYKPDDVQEYVPTGDWDDSFSTGQDFNQGSLFQQPAPSTPEFQSVSAPDDGAFALSSTILDGSQPASPDYTPPKSPPVSPPVSPDYAPPASPDYAPPTSPDYAPPTSPDYAPPASPDYAPSASPDYVPPASPDYAPPASPDYAPPTSPPGTPPVTQPMTGGGGGLAGPAGPANINVFNIGATTTEQPPASDDKTTTSDNKEQDGEQPDGGQQDGQSGGGPSIKFYKLSHDQGLDAAKTLQLEPDKVIKSGESDNGESNSSGGGKKIIF